MVKAEGDESENVKKKKKKNLVVKKAATNSSSLLEVAQGYYTWY